MSGIKHVFTPEPTDGRIVSITPFRDVLIVACDYAVYQLKPESGAIEWTVTRLSPRSLFDRIVYELA